MFRIGKIKELCHGIIRYIRSHLWISIMGSLMLLFLLVVLIFQEYLKNEYYDYLLDETWKTESAVLSVASNSLNSILGESLYVCGEMATDKDLYNYVNRLIEADKTTFIRQRSVLFSHLQSIAFHSTEVSCVTIVNQDGVLIEGPRYWSGGEQSVLWEEEYSQTLESLRSGVMMELGNKTSGHYKVCAVPAMYEPTSKMQVFHIAVPIIGFSSSFERANAVMIVSFRMDSFAKGSGLSEMNAQEYLCSYLTDASGNIIYHPDRQWLGRPVTAYQASSPTVELEKALSYFGWTAHISIDPSDLRSDVNRLYNQAIGVYILLLAVSCLIWQFVVRRVLRPITSIGEAMKEIQAGKPNQKIQVEGTNELWQLAEQYNDMVDALHQQRKEVQRNFEEKALSIQQRNQAERQALESQIDAHFICNTLNAINYNVLEAGNFEVAEMLRNLSDILRYTFSKKGENVTLGQEFRWVEQYLSLQKFRLMDRFEYEIDFPEEYSEWPCCRLFIQPFVENSILHGFANIDRGGFIRITGRPDGNRFRVEIRDNGCGIQADISNVIQESLQGDHNLELAGNGNGIGIRNVVTRMKMFFGEGFEAELETEVGEGTRFTFWLPLPSENGMEEEEEVL